MADIETPIDIEETPVDVEMDEEAAEVEVDEAADLPDTLPDLPARTPFLDYLRSPIVDILVTDGDTTTTLHAHEALLLQSPILADQCASLPATGPRQLTMTEDIDAAGSVLEWLYNAEYFPKRSDPNDKMSTLEDDLTIPKNDDTGIGLLRHARVYTLADKLGLPALKSLAHAKIHRTSSTAKGEIAYARYVYQYSSPDDQTMRGPIAAFWATRSHVLRHEAEQEFRAMCLEFPQFGFDVLSRVLDQKENARGGGGGGGASGSQPTVQVGRKRARQG